MSALDPRLAFLHRAAARLVLVESGELSLHDAFDALECRICGSAPCRTPSFCKVCEEADRYRKQDRAVREHLRFLRSLLDDGVSFEAAYWRIFERRRQYQRQRLRSGVAP